MNAFKNPVWRTCYSRTVPGCGDLVRDLKNKIKITKEGGAKEMNPPLGLPGVHSLGRIKRRLSRPLEADETHEVVT